MTRRCPHHRWHEYPKRTPPQAIAKACEKPLLGHTKMGSTVRYLGVELEDALAISEDIDL